MTLLVVAIAGWIQRDQQAAIVCVFGHDELSMVFQSIATPSAELEYVSDRDGRFKRPLERCKLLTRWAFEYFDQTGKATQIWSERDRKLEQARKLRRERRANKVPA